MRRDELRDGVLAALDAKSASLSEIAGVVGVSPKAGTLRNVLAELVGEGAVERSGRMYARCKKGAKPAKSASSGPGSASAPASEGATSTSACPEPPAELGDAGRACWFAAWGVEWTDTLDLGVIRHACRLEDEAQALCEVLDRDGLVQARPIVSPKGDVVGEEWVSHPGVGELRRLDKSLGQLRAALGLDPASRARLKLQATVDARDALDELKARRAARRAAMGGE